MQDRLLASDASAPIVVDEFLRRRRERERAAKLEAFGRRNQEAFMEQRAFMAGNICRTMRTGAGGD